jgi:V8-like Glu-specific endopeptidase
MRLKSFLILLAIFQISFRAIADDGRKFGMVSEERQAQCAKAVEDLPPEVKIRRIELFDKRLLEQLAPQLQEYDDNCFETLDGLKDETITTLREVVGFLFITQGARTDIVCAAFRITDHLIATAAHCLWWRDAQIDPSRLQFRLMSQPTRSFQPTSSLQKPNIHDEHDLSDQQDFAVLKVDTSAIGLHIPSNFFREQLPYGDAGYLLIPGINVFDYLAHPSDASSHWVDSVRVSKARSCFRHYVDTLGGNADHCVFSVCQTLEAMSGAPIFGYDTVQQSVFIGGLHLRDGLLSDDPLVRANRECGVQPSYNVGITLPKAVVNLTRH